VITSGPALQHAAELSDTRTSLQSLREHITVKVATNADVITIRVLDPGRVALPAAHDHLLALPVSRTTTRQAAQLS
jgi:hypothetical protein